MKTSYRAFLTSEEYFELKAGYEGSITVLSGDIEALEKGMDALDDQPVRYRAMEKDAKITGAGPCTDGGAY